MCHPFLRDARFWLVLLRIDREMAEEARQGRCRHCGGPLHRADYERQPRGIESVELSIEFRYRLSFSCGRKGCRKRLTPPSVRFLGRKVYLGALVVLVTAMRQGATPPGMRKLRDLFGVDRRTVSRWREFWQEAFCHTKFWEMRKGPLSRADGKLLPKSLLDGAAGSSLREKLQSVLRFLSPTTICGGLVLKAVG